MESRRPFIATAPTANDIAIGHDIIALISSAMYTEPLTVYREICQNSADAIDEAVQSGVLASDEGRVDVTVDALHRTITVRDNGAGVPNTQFTSRMCSIGASRKRGTSARGFRGIGRLVGLGYCQELVFRSRSAADEKVYEAHWDCRALREALRSPAYTSLVDIIGAVVRVSNRKCTAEEPAHFFDVELRKVVRLANDGLVNAVLVDEYLSQVAPVPFHPDFSHGATIEKYLRRNEAYSTVSVHINGRAKPVTRPYRDTIAISATKSARLQKPTFFDVPAQDGGIAAIGWIAHHEYFGALPASARVRGLRARVGNLQIGEDNPFEHVFPESRFNQWTVGEVHVMDDRIVANARRDYFEPNAHFDNLCNYVAERARDVARRCRSLSASRRRHRSLGELEQALTLYAGLLKRNRVARIMRKELIDDVTAHIERTRKLANADAQDHILLIEDRMGRLLDLGGRDDRRASQREMGQADVLRLIRDKAPNGTALSLTILQMLKDLP